MTSGEIAFSRSDITKMFRGKLLLHSLTKRTTNNSGKSPRQIPAIITARHIKNTRRITALSIATCLTAKLRFTTQRKGSAAFISRWSVSTSVFPFHTRHVGGGGDDGPLTYLSRAKKRKQISPPNFEYRFIYQFSHPDNWIFRSFDRSAVKCIRVTLCSADFGQK